jgi:hypothetical protein
MSPKTILFIALLVLAPCVSFGQRIPVWSVCDTTHMQYPYSADHLLAITASGQIATIGDVVGNTQPIRFDHIIRVSTDSGSSWNEIYSQPVTNQEWLAIEHPSTDLFVVMGDSQHYLGWDKNGFQFFLLVSRDAGTTWSTIFFDTNTEILDVRMLSSDYGAAILTHLGNKHDSLPNKSPDDLLITNDGWKTWTTMQLPHDVKWCPKLACFGKGEFGTFTWSQSDHAYKYYRISQNNVVSRGLLPGAGEMCFINEREGWCAGTKWGSNKPSGFVSHTTDGGLTWDFYADTIGNQTGVQLRTIAFADSLHGVVAGDVMLSTKDGGITWRTFDPPYAAMLNSNGGFVYDIIYPKRDLAFGILGSTLIRYVDRNTIAAPDFHLRDNAGPVLVSPIAISWTPVHEATYYQVQLGFELQTEWKDSRHFFDEPLLDTLLTDTQFVFRNLDFGTGYFGRVRAISGSDTSDWHQSGGWFHPTALFYTVSHPNIPVPPTILAPPSGTHVIGSVKMRISSVPDAISYGIKFFYYGTATGIDTTVSDTAFEIRGLHDVGFYGVEVSANLPGDATDWTSGAYGIYNDLLSSVSAANNESSIAVFPNPTKDDLHIQLSSPIAPLIFDALGRRQDVPIRYDATGAVLEVHALPAGTYSIRGLSDAKALRFVVQH